MDSSKKPTQDKKDQIRDSQKDVELSVEELEERIAPKKPIR